MCQRPRAEDMMSNMTIVPQANFLLFLNCLLVSINICFCQVLICIADNIGTCTSLLIKIHHPLTLNNILVSFSSILSLFSYLLLKNLIFFYSDGIIIGTVFLCNLVSVSLLYCI